MKRLRHWLFNFAAAVSSARVNNPRTALPILGVCLNRQGGGLPCTVLPIVGTIHSTGGSMNSALRWRGTVLAIAIMVIAIAVSSSLVVGQPAAANPPIRWEYKVLQTNLVGEKDLNAAGADGWELVTAVRDAL